ncbi:prepilin peptidase [Enterobacterales bacterium CwR94]|nr:prepilin peptidase [Enterobacterales bacterium CwR94]
MWNDAVLWILGALVALSVGSFLNVVIWRLPQQIMHPDCGLTLSLPRSHCPQCKTPLRWRDNLPLLSWLHLRGRCRHCGSAISWRYPAIEALTAALSLTLALFLPWDATLLAALLLVWFLIPLVAIDWQHQLLPDALTLPLLWLGLLLHAFQLLPGSLEQGVIGACIGYLLFRLLSDIWQRWRGVEALGQGDAKLLAALLAWLGWPALPMLLLMAASSGIILAVLLGRGRVDLQRAIPFGPSLALAGAGLFIASLS